jgi:hypothetical protein
MRASVEKAYPTSEDKTIRFATQHAHAARRRFAATRSGRFWHLYPLACLPDRRWRGAADTQTLGVTALHCGETAAGE